LHEYTHIIARIEVLSAGAVIPYVRSSLKSRSTCYTVVASCKR
jgi:hypothetical protein